jgi:hypothetical protein
VRGAVNIKQRGDPALGKTFPNPGEGLLTNTFDPLYDSYTDEVNATVNSLGTRHAQPGKSASRNASDVYPAQRGTLYDSDGQSVVGTGITTSAPTVSPHSRSLFKHELNGTSLGLAAKAMHQRLRPVEFRAAIYAKGWQFKALAAFWGVTNVTLSRWASDENRAPYLDDAVRGLRAIGPALRLPKSWQAELFYAVPMRPPATSRSAGRSPQKLGPGFRYRGYMVVGAVVSASRDFGSMAEFGARGVVLHVEVHADQETYQVIFESGCTECFTPDLVDEYLVTTGLECSQLVNYTFVDEQSAIADWAVGMFATAFQAPT